MSSKRTLGEVLTIAGIIGLIYSAICIMQDHADIKILLVIGLISVLAFFTGLSVASTTQTRFNRINK